MKFGTLCELRRPMSSTGGVSYYEIGDAAEARLGQVVPGTLVIHIRSDTDKFNNCCSRVLLNGIVVSVFNDNIHEIEL